MTIDRYDPPGICEPKSTRAGLLWETWRYRGDRVTGTQRHSRSPVPRSLDVPYRTPCIATFLCNWCVCASVPHGAPPRYTVCPRSAAMAPLIRDLTELETNWAELVRVYSRWDTGYRERGVLHFINVNCTDSGIAGLSSIASSLVPARQGAGYECWQVAELPVFPTYSRFTSPR